jgi:hypothetical protein
MVRERLRLEIAEEYRESLAAAGLAGFDRLSGAPLGRLVSSGRGRSVRFLRLAHRGRETGFYLKRVTRPRRLLRSLLLGRTVGLATTREAQTLGILRERGVPAAPVAAFGERRLLGRIPLRGFLLVEEVVGEEAAELFRGGDRELRGRLLAALARISARLASLGFRQPPRVKDFICTSRAGPDLVIFDQEREAQRTPPDEAGLVRFLAHAYGKHRRNGLGLTAREIRTFLREFSGAVEGGVRPTARELLRRTRTAVRRLGRTSPRYACVLERDETHATAIGAGEADHGGDSTTGGGEDA